MDREDWIYLVSVALVALGAGMFHPGAGFVCAGIGTALPFLLTMFRGRPTKKE